MAKAFTCGRLARLDSGNQAEHRVGFPLGRARRVRCASSLRNRLCRPNARISCKSATLVGRSAYAAGKPCDLVGPAQAPSRRRSTGVAAYKFDTPIWRAVQHVRAAIDDIEHSKCYPRTLQAIRQAALNGQIKIRGHAQIDEDGPQRFSSVSSDISPDYWKISTIGPMATDEIGRGGYPHTNPESGYSWGPKGMYVEEGVRRSNCRFEGDKKSMAS